MRNDTHRWSPPAPLSRTADDVALTEITGLTQHIVSGTDVLAHFADKLIGWPDVIAPDSYALSMRRDRVLLVGQANLPIGFAPDTGFAVTDMSDAYTVIDLTGPDAFALLRMGAEIRLDQPSRSVVRQLFGCDVLLCCLADAPGFRLHLPRAHAQSLTAHLCGTNRP